MESSLASATGRLWRRDKATPVGAVGDQVTFAAPSKTAVARAKRSKRVSASVTLLPITPLHEVVPGALEIDEERARVVFLAPLTCAAAEKYFAITKESSDNSDSDGDAAQGDESNAIKKSRGGRENQSPRKTLSLIDAKVSRLLAKHYKRLSAGKPQGKHSAARSSVFDQRSSYDAAAVVEIRRVVSPLRSKPHSDRQEDEQLERLKQHVHSMPATDEDREQFWQTMRNYQRLQMQYRASLLNNHASAMGFNMEAAWNKKLVEERHQLWVQAHDERVEATRARKQEEDEKYEQRVFESTTEYRAQIRVLREVRLRLMLEAQMIMPTVMLSAVTQRWLERLQSHWRQQHLSKKLRGIIHFWCKQRASRGVHVHAARLLLNWLQKSVAVKSVAFKVFRGIRNYVRCVKKIQRLWKCKSAKRLVRFLILEKMWAEHETEIVDQANEDFEKRRAKVEHKLVQVKKRVNSNASLVLPSNMQWLTFVSEEIRGEVIREFIRDQEQEFTRFFRHQEEDLFPQLVQTLRDENPNKARSYIKAVASSYAILGRVYDTLRHFPGAVDEVAPVEPFDVRMAPIQELILRARDRSPPDTTGARFGTV